MNQILRLKAHKKARAEALQISRRAEQARGEAAEREAKCGVQYGEEPEWIAVKDKPPSDVYDTLEADIPYPEYWIYVPSAGREGHRVHGPYVVRNGDWQFDSGDGVPVSDNYVTHYKPYYTPDPPEEEA